MEITAVPPPVVLKIKRQQEMFRAVPKSPPDPLRIDLSDDVLEDFRVRLQKRDSLRNKPSSVQDITERQSRRTYTRLTLVGELARYFAGDGISPFDIDDLLASGEPGIVPVLDAVNLANDILYEVLVPHIFYALFEVQRFQRPVEDEVELIRGYNAESNKLPTFTFRAQEHLIARRDYPVYNATRYRSFHLDVYCFDSKPEVEFFDRVIADAATDRVYFTGMLVHGQSAFKVYYIHPESHTVCNYHPDFLVFRTDGKAHLVEVKSQWKKEDPVVMAKRDAAEALAEGSQFRHETLSFDCFPINADLVARLRCGVAILNEGR